MHLTIRVKCLDKYIQAINIFFQGGWRIYEWESPLCHHRLAVGQEFWWCKKFYRFYSYRLKLYLNSFTLYLLWKFYIVFAMKVVKQAVKYVYNLLIDKKNFESISFLKSRWHCARAMLSAAC